MNLQPIADFIRYLRFTDGLSSSDVDRSFVYVQGDHSLGYVRKA